MEQLEDRSNSGMYLAVAASGDWKSFSTWAHGLAVPDISDKKSGLLKHLARRNVVTTGA
jgi:hypothetical protein